MAICLFACKNSVPSDEKKYLDSLEKYKPTAEILDDSVEIVRKNRYKMYLILYEEAKKD